MSGRIGHRDLHDRWELVWKHPGHGIASEQGISCHADMILDRKVLGTC
jgi:hypothetical protein